jgi:hypothetical protein
MLRGYGCPDPDQGFFPRGLIRIRKTLSYRYIYVHFCRSGWVGVLARWKQSPNLLVSLPATKALCNMDQEFGKYRSHIFVFIWVLRSRARSRKLYRYALLPVPVLIFSFYNSFSHQTGKIPVFEETLARMFTFVWIKNKNKKQRSRCGVVYR